MELLNKILKILEGIDKTETETTPECNGWWETSTGADFGAKKIEEIKALFENEPKMNIEFTVNVEPRT
jgi:hypothetical protein